MRQLTQTVAPACSILTIDETREHLRVTSADEDTTIALYMSAAEARLDGREGILGRALIAQTWQMELPAFPIGAIRLPLPPFQEVVGFEYDTTAGVTVDVDPASFRVRMDKGQAVLEPVTAWPNDVQAVRIEFKCGYGDDPGDLPGTIRAAALLIVTALYENRADAADVGPKGTVGRLLAPYRVP